MEHWGELLNHFHSRGLDSNGRRIATRALIVRPYHGSNRRHLTARTRVTDVGTCRNLVGHFVPSKHLTNNYERGFGQLNKDRGVRSEVGTAHLGIDPEFL